MSGEGWAEATPAERVEVSKLALAAGFARIHSTGRWECSMDELVALVANLKAPALPLEASTEVVTKTAEADRRRIVTAASSFGASELAAAHQAMLREIAANEAEGFRVTHWLHSADGGLILTAIMERPAVAGPQAPPPGQRYSPPDGGFVGR